MAIGAIVSALVLLSSCGGGGGGTSSTTSTGAGVISGTVTKGPLGGATVTVFNIGPSGSQGSQIGTTNTDGQGNFAMQVGNPSGSIMIQVNGGTFTDEATGQQMTMGSTDMMTAVIPTLIAGSTMSGIQVTPITSMAQRMAQNMTGGMTQANITQANTAMGQYFSVSDILTVHPMNPNSAGSGAPANQDQRNYGMTIAAMSQYAHDIGMPNSSGMITAMMNDASDGVMNGTMSGGTGVGMGGGMPSGTMMQPNAGTTGIATAMTNFLQSSANLSGLTAADMSALITKMDTSNGVIISGMGSGGGMMSGTATMGPVMGAAITAFALNPDGTRGALAGSSVTDAQGNFTMPMGTFSGSLMIQLSGGTFNDEATGQAMSMQGAIMTAAIPNMPQGATISGIQITPITSMAQNMAQNMAGGMTQANITQANGAMGRYFSVSDIISVRPMDPTVSGSGASATQDQRNYGMTVAAMSQYAHGIGMPDSAGMDTAMMSDAADGIMNGMMGGTPINMGGMGGMMASSMMQSNAGTSGMASAMTSFIQSPGNKSGLTQPDMQVLINKLTSSNGLIQ